MAVSTRTPFHRTKPKCNALCLLVVLILIRFSVLIDLEFGHNADSSTIDAPSEVRTSHTRSDASGKQYHNKFHHVWDDADFIISPQVPEEGTWLMKTGGKENNIHGSASAIITAKIPKIIHKVYFQKDGKYAPILSNKKELKEAHQSWIMKNPGYDIWYYNLDTAREYLGDHFHPVFLRAFDCIEAFAGKTDLFRMAIIYREGGWYSDWKQVPLLNNILDHIQEANIGIDFFAPYDKGSEQNKKDGCVQICFFGARVEHPFVAETLRRILINVQTQYYGPQAIYNSGPCVFGAAIRNITAQSPLLADKSAFGAYYFGSQTIHFHAKNKTIKVIQHKCSNCGNSQDWEYGNNYKDLHNDKQYYCEDAASIFSPAQHSVWKK